MEFECICCGSTNIVIERMKTPYLNSTRTEEDFTEVACALAETDPGASCFSCVMVWININQEAWYVLLQNSTGLWVDFGHKGKGGILNSLTSYTDIFHDKSHGNTFYIHT